MARKGKKLDKKQSIFIIIVGIIVILSLLLIVSGLFGNFESVKLKKNNKEIFTIKDLTVNNLKFLSTSEEVTKELGKPKSTKEYSKNNYKYIDYYYSGLKLLLKVFRTLPSIVKKATPSEPLPILINFKLER